MKPRIILSGGGTAGSVAPLLAIVAHLNAQQQSIDWLFVGTQDGPEQTLVEAANIPFQALPAGKLRRYFSWRNVSDFFQVWRGFVASRRLIRSWKPDVVVSAGSYVSVPLVWAAKFAGIKVLVHQQDVQPGLANRMMIWPADRITVSFESSLQGFPKNKTQYTGNPVRQDMLRGSIEKARSIFNLKPNIPVLLIIGGSTGSSFFNTIVGSVAYRLVKHWQIIHITGRNKDAVELHDDRYRAVKFLTWELPHALAIADVVVSRAGLGALTELAALGKPTIFIPMEHSHQEVNAKLIDQYKAGQVLDQGNLAPALFYDTVENLRRNPDQAEQLGQNLRQLHREDAVDRLGKLILTLVEDGSG